MMAGNEFEHEHEHFAFGKVYDWIKWDTLVSRPIGFRPVVQRSDITLSGASRKT